MSAAEDARESNEYLDRINRSIVNVKVEGIDYTVEGIESIRSALGEYRQRAMKNWPEEIEMTLVLTHAIALLAYLKDLETAQQENEKARKAAKRG